MTKDEEKLLNYIKILADKNKYKVIRHLMSGEECVCVLVEKLDLEQTLVSLICEFCEKQNWFKIEKLERGYIVHLIKKTFLEIEAL